jgi:hypothetical protein
MVSGSGE